MESGKQNNIVLGVVGAIGVVFISYLLYRSLGSKSPGGHQRRRKSSQTLQRKTSSKNESQLPQKTDAEGTSRDLGEDEDPRPLIVEHFDQENLPVSSKKSDRSSDESSYDVIEAEDVEEKNGKSARERELEESLLDDHEASVVVVDSDRSSSFYHSADETMTKDMKGDVGGNVSADEEFFSQSVSHRKEGAPAWKADRSTQEQSAEVGDGSSVSVTESEQIHSSLATKLADKSAEVDGPGKYRTTASIQFSREQKDDDVVVKSKPTMISTVTGSGQIESGRDISVSSPKDSGQADVVVVEERDLSNDEITAALTACQNSPMSVTKDQIDILVLLLQRNNPKLQPTVLDSLVRVSAFTQNNPHLRSAGCESVVCQQIRQTCISILKEGLEDDTLLVSQAKVLTNLSMDPKAVVNLETCVSPLINVLIQPLSPESVQLSVLRPLINLCSLDRFHQYYTPAIQRLYALLDNGSYNVQLQSVKVLVNLSLNQTLVPHMLSARAPDSLLDLLDKPTHAEVILRVLTMIGNLRAAIASLNIDQSSLPAMHKAESPKTMYTALCGVVKTPLLRNKVYRLTRHSEEDIRHMASKLYTMITMVKK